MEMYHCTILLESFEKEFYRRSKTCMVHDMWIKKLLTVLLPVAAFQNRTLFVTEPTMYSKPLT